MHVTDKQLNMNVIGFNQARGQNLDGDFCVPRVDLSYNHPLQHIPDDN